MDRKRFELALMQLGPSDWELFEQLASAFAVIDYGTLRTVASYSGDNGRDAYLQSPDDDETVVFQYSVTADPASKIRATGKRLSTTIPTARNLIYVTSQHVGISCDDAKRDVRSQYKISVDVWDRNWFLDRINTHTQRERAAESLARALVDPLLATYDVISDRAPSLTRDEERCAAVYLALQSEERKSDKGWTKVTFEALVRAALRGTDSSNRMARLAIYESVSAFAPTNTAVHSNVDRALRALTGSSIRHWRQKDEFCLAYAEQVRILQRSLELSDLQANFRSALLEHLEPEVRAVGADFGDDLAPAAWLAQKAVDAVLRDSGERLASALDSGQVVSFRSEGIERLVDRLVSDEPLLATAANRQAVIRTASAAIRSSNPSVVRYLRIWKDSYTLFSLLHETPDVQKTIVKLFSHGRIWMDSNVILPLIAELLIPDEEDRKWTHLIQAAVKAGLTFCVTDGVAEEISAQMRRSIAYARNRQQGRTWLGRVPFLYVVYALSGSDPASLASWVGQFQGQSQPEQDILEFLEEQFSIRPVSLTNEAESATVELRSAVHEIFREVREDRYRNFDPLIARRLIEHDVECYLGAVQTRRSENQSSLGFTSWWLTLDGVAYRVHSKLPERYAGSVPPSPVMSPDFLLNYLELGPLRNKIGADTALQLPSVMDISFLEGAPEELLTVAERVRVENEGSPPRIIRREIRDALNAARGEAGAILSAGMDSLERDIMEAIAGIAGAAEDA